MSCCRFSVVWTVSVSSCFPPLSIYPYNKLLYGKCKPKTQKYHLFSASYLARRMRSSLISQTLTCQLARSWRTHRPLIRIPTAAVRPFPDSSRICPFAFGGCTEAALCWLSADLGLELASSQRRRGERKPQACVTELCRPAHGHP